MGKEIEVKFVHERSTPGTHVFREVDSNGQLIKNNRDAKIGTLYMQKSVFNGGGAPAKISMRISVD